MSEGGLTDVDAEWLLERVSHRAGLAGQQVQDLRGQGKCGRGLLASTHTQVCTTHLVDARENCSDFLCSGEHHLCRGGDTPF